MGSGDRDGNGAQHVQLCCAKPRAESTEKMHTDPIYMSALLLQVQGTNGQIARYNYYGVYALPQSREARDIAGQNLQVRGHPGSLSEVCVL